MVHLSLRVAALTVVASGVIALTSVQAAPASAATAIDLGTATSYAVLGGTTVTNTGPSVITGDLGVSPGSAGTGFPPGIVVAGTIHAADASTSFAQEDLTTAYNVAAGLTPTASG